MNSFQAFKRQELSTFYQAKTKQGGTLWRDDNRCGPMYPLKDNSPGQCDPNHANEYTCCSPGGWCGHTPAHCTCSGCIDYNPSSNKQTDNQAVVSQFPNYTPVCKT